MMNSEARKRSNPRIPADVLVERLRFVLQGAQLHVGAGDVESVGRNVSEAQNLVDQLREAI